MEPGVTLLSSTFVYGSKVPFTCPSGEVVLPTPLFVIPTHQAAFLSTLLFTAMQRDLGREEQPAVLPFDDFDVVLKQIYKRYKSNKN